MQPAARSNKMSRYKITEDLETTPTADFHLARNVKKDEIVLMKILKKNYYTLEECKGNKEVQVCLKLNHANVLKFFEFINDSNQLLMIFEYIPDNVKRVMKRRDQPFSEAETKGIMLQVFHGLSYIHGQGFIHRNLRPELLVCNEDATEVKISDFSLARSSLDTINTIADYTGQLHPYLPPEVLLQVEKYGTPVDMWAAGCVMAELLTGSPLFQSDVMEIKDLMSKICVIIGTFTKGEWQEGSQALRQAMFNLPKVEVGRGLGEAGAKVGADAKGLIMDLVVWNPSKRKTADQAIRDDFFKSDGEFVNSTENQEILKFAREKMQTWRETYQADLTRNSLAEFDRIIADVTHKAGHQPQRNPFQGFETSNPLLGDSTPRGKFGSPPQQRKLGVKGGADDPFGQFRPQRLQMDLSPRKSEKNPFTEEIKSREEHRRSHQGPPANKDSLFAPEEPPKNVDHRDRADKMRQQNYLKYRTKYGDDFLRSQLGDKLASNEKETVAPSNNRKGSVAQDRGQSRDPVRTRYDDFYKPSWADPGKPTRQPHAPIF
ncbi:hypothetical protein DPMN_177041 [Dreissena polymorpha]|uniref:Protein kinase domain-containing protein n=1 Tax=Dreissena polymorpha TaxID=45954 RepID=A0A9D4EC79_DREPO|nr:hypothetical protein DPMN_177041 [Dreissena polymorpha]